jgi:hypothetical protein
MNAIKIYQKLPNGYRFMIEKHSIDNIDICTLKIIDSFYYIVAERIIDQYLDDIEFELLIDEMLIEVKDKRDVY